MASRGVLHYRVAYRSAGALDIDRILYISLVADVGVVADVLGAGDDHIFEVLTAAEDFHAVVRAVVDLDMVDLGARTDARRGQALQLLVGAEDEARDRKSVV